MKELNLNSFSNELCEQGKLEKYLSECDQSNETFKRLLKICIEDSKKYASLTEWASSSLQVFTFVLLKGWDNLCCGHMNDYVDSSNVSQLDCILDALEYRSIRYWFKYSPLMAANAKKSGVFNICTEHMDKTKLLFTNTIVEASITPKRFSIFESLAEVKNYKTVSEWLSNNYPLYNWVHNNGLLDVFTEHMAVRSSAITDEQLSFISGHFFSSGSWENTHKRTWAIAKYRGKTKELAKIVLRSHGISLPTSFNNFHEYYAECKADAANYATKGEWYDKSSTLYLMAKKLGVFDECTQHMNKRTTFFEKWTKKACIEEAKKYETLTDWSKGSWPSYNKAIDNNWKNDCTKHMSSYVAATLDLCIGDAKNYKTPTEWAKNSEYLYYQALSNDWYEECTKHMKKRPRRTIWSEEKILEDAKKYKFSKDWRVQSNKAFRLAKLLGVYEKCSEHMLPEKFRKYEALTLKQCYEFIKQYSTKTEWRKKNKTLYDYIEMKGWMIYCTFHMLSKRKIMMCSSACIVISSRFSNKSEWEQNDQASYLLCLEQGWIDPVWDIGRALVLA